MSTPDVSVVIPAYNASQHIAEALASIRDQTLKQVEVIVVDDGSVDDTVAKVEPFARELDLTIIRQANGGASAARNAGILRARGRYCAFLDADDVMMPERLAAEVAVLDADPELVLVHTDLMTFDDTGIIHRTRRAFSDPCGGMVLERLLMDNFVTTSTVMVRKQPLIDAGMFPLARRIAHDFELWLRMAIHGKFAFIDEPLIRYRYRPGSLSENRLTTALDALGVIETFWREHPQLRRAHPALYRKSFAQHLVTAGRSALGQRQRRLAFGYLVRSLRLDPGNRITWKSLARTLVGPARSQLLTSNP
jgi:glycosyltransferase involved in cell wall biosynthesis